MYNLTILSQTVTLEIIGKVSFIDDINNVLHNSVKADDTLTGTITYYSDIIDSNTSSTIGHYFNYSTPAGISVKINNLTFRTDANNINMLVEVVCKPSNDGGTAIVFRSYNNQFEAGNNFTEKIIGWQLDDPFGTALKNDSIVTKIDLNKFEQLSGFVISADSGYYEKHFKITSLITEIRSTARNLNNIIIDKDSSVLQNDPDIITVDTTLESITDFDGNIYKIVKVGEQIWMRENLRSLHYDDGTTIENVHVYNDNEYNAAIYGRLYSWNAIMHGSLSSTSIPSGVKGVCPCGWHMPSDNEWYTLINYLGGTSIAGSKMKETGVTYWEYPNVGAENTTFLSVRPAGNMQSESFYQLGTTTAFWTTAKYHISYARYVFLDNLTTRAVIYNDGNISDLYSVRCLKNENIINGLNDNPADINNSITIYPNPASQKLFINGLSHNTNVSIFDLDGKMFINEQTISNSIDIQKLKNGIYLIKIVDKNGVSTTKFIKQ